MATYEWPAGNYAVGSYIQAAVAEQYLRYLNPDPADYILDIGCGDGSFTTKIITKVPKGRVLGIDRSENMLQLARAKAVDYPNFSVQKSDVLEMNFKQQFDHVVSFWCLHWCMDLPTAYKNIYEALKPGGKILTLLPTGDDPFITSYETVKASGDFPQLKEFVPPIDYQKVRHLPAIIARLPFKNAQVDMPKQTILLPSLEIFRKFVNGLAFFNGHVPEEDIPLINEALVKAYDVECQKKYRGEYWFNFSIFLVRAEK